MSLLTIRDAHFIRAERAWPWAEREKDRIDAHWAARVSRTASLFDGRVLLGCDLSVRDGILEGICFETDYSKFVAWRDFGWPDTSVCNMFALAALRAEDGGYLLGVMGADTASAGQVYFPCGTPDPSDVRDGVLDLGGSVLRELHEETGLSASDVRLGDGFTLVRDGQFAALFRDVAVPGRAEEVRARVRAILAAQHERELEDLHIVRGPGDLDAARMPGFMMEFFAARFAQDAG